ncbi:MAG: hypothetical protein IJY93_03305 [Clostridia bacterium]|nr:hypothetical protein [Clostridia bacterium]
MFGYVKPVSAELKVKEYELYRAVYCGLCEALGRNTTHISRLSLSYDFVFLALVRMSLAGEVGKIERHRCLAHPTKKRAVLVGAKQLDYCARLSSVLTYHKLCDDIADTRGFKRFGSRLLLPFASRIRKRAKFEASTEEYISSRLAALSQLEKENCASLDMAAEPFGELMAYVCAYGFEAESVSARIAAEIGRHIGRYIYIIDAVDDLEDDIKSGSYNPFRVMYENPIEGLCNDCEQIKRALTMELMGIEAAIGLMEFDAVYEYGEIIKNIIYLGLPEFTNKVFGKYIKENDQVGET